MWFVYVLLCGDKSLYTGVTNDLEKRFASHKNGTGSKYTKARKAVRIIYKEALSSRSDALRRENEIKTWTRDQKINRLNLNGLL